MAEHRPVLTDCSKVAIVGGGPAGSFFALFLSRYAKTRGIKPEVTIYQGRDFNEPGPRGCKGCAGIVSASLLRNLAELNLTIPEEVVQRKIDRYTVHNPYLSVTINNPEKGAQILSVYRGNGPRTARYERPVSFDGWLLNEARKCGANIEYQMVSGIRLAPGERPVIEVQGRPLEYDLVVLAAGTNGRLLPVRGLEYVPPRTQRLAQDELYLGSEQVEKYFGNEARAFLVPHSGVIFGTLVPKGPFVNVSVLSKEADPVSVRDFLSLDIVRRILPKGYERVCGCQPRVAVSLAENYYADRFVAVGDAAVSRLYKDGMGSALLTAREAALIAVEHGLSRDDFAQYYEPFCRRIDHDNRWGRRIFSFTGSAKDSRTTLWAYHRLIASEQDNQASTRPFTKAVWGMLTGSYSYGDIARMTLRPASLGAFSIAVLRETLKRQSGKEQSAEKRLHIGSRKVLILGSGFGGTYALRHLVPSLNRNENVETTMVSNENFFLFSPLLHEVAMSGIETRHIAYPIRRLQWRDRFNFIQAEVEKIDLRSRAVATSAGTLDFDYLILALGSVPNTSALDSMESNVFTLKTLNDSIFIRNHIIEIFERATAEKDAERQRELLTFVVSGGGYTGIQLVTELDEFIRRSLLKVYRAVDPQSIRIILVETEPKIVADMHTRLGAYIMKHLKEAGIEVRLKSRITRVWHDGVEINGKENMATGTVLWVAGVVANPCIAELDVKKDDAGRVMVNERLEVPGAPGVYAVGDCAHFEDPKTGYAIPPRAHNAVRQGKVAAMNILADIRGQDKVPYRYSNPSEMVSLGAAKAVFRFHGLRMYGFPARVLWLAGYSLLITGAYNRLRVLIDWLLCVAFGRDTTLLRLRR
ncbi:MAG: FAD-dependent oxidoreductase [Chloroflexi bacterium]|nr:FAD-dependent oxidoreductase [Chloroflexota bacterium]